MDVFDAVINIVFFIPIFYLISRFAYFVKYTKGKLNEMDKKLGEMRYIDTRISGSNE